MGGGRIAFSTKNVLSNIFFLFPAFLCVYNIQIQCVLQDLAVVVCSLCWENTNTTFDFQIAIQLVRVQQSAIQLVEYSLQNAPLRPRQVSSLERCPLFRGWNVHIITCIYVYPPNVQLGALQMSSWERCPLQGVLLNVYLYIRVYI